MTTTELIEAAKKAQRPGYYLSSAHTPDGRIVCYVDHAHANAKTGTHVHCRFELNGRRVARSVVVSLIGA